ncbi:hypothetical protein, partial [Streptomyces sp. SID335]
MRPCEGERLWRTRPARLSCPGGPVRLGHPGARQPAGHTRSAALLALLRPAQAVHAAAQQR